MLFPPLPSGGAAAVFAGGHVYAESRAACSGAAGGVSFCTLLERPKDFLRNMAFYVPLFLMIAVTNPLFSQ